MNRATLLTILLIAFTLSLSAQKTVTGSIRGKVVDTAGKQSLAEATLSLMDLKDSSSTGFATANEKGMFEMKGLDEGRYRLLITFGGYQNITRVFSITREKSVIDFGTIYMERRSTTLQEVIVERPPISVKKDTVEYNAGAFKTKPNEDVEGLLKKLPGVQVDRDGTVKSQGETVQKVYVDGKEFFGTDPKLATKNLTADMVESVQVFDDMSDQAKFTKIDDGSRQKAMNIKLKKDKKNGYFGKINVGAGTDSRYDNSLSFNRFKGNRQVSLIGAVNNTNKQGFSFSDIISTMGGFGNGGPGGGVATGAHHRLQLHRCLSRRPRQLGRHRVCELRIAVPGPAVVARGRQYVALHRGLGRARDPSRPHHRPHHQHANAGTRPGARRYPHSLGHPDCRLCQDVGLDAA